MFLDEDLVNEDLMTVGTDVISDDEYEIPASNSKVKFTYNGKNFSSIVDLIKVECGLTKLVQPSMIIKPETRTIKEEQEISIEMRLHNLLGNETGLEDIDFKCNPDRKVIRTRTAHKGYPEKR